MGMGWQDSEIASGHAWGGRIPPAHDLNTTN